MTPNKFNPNDKVFTIQWYDKPTIERVTVSHVEILIWEHGYDVRYGFKEYQNEYHLLKSDSYVFATRKEAREYIKSLKK